MTDRYLIDPLPASKFKTSSNNPFKTLFSNASNFAFLGLVLLILTREMGIFFSGFNLGGLFWNVEQNKLLNLVARNSLRKMFIVGENCLALVKYKGQGV